MNRSRLRPEIIWHVKIHLDDEMGARARTCWVLLCRVKVSQHIDLSFFLTWLSLTPNWWDLLFSLSLGPGSLLHFKLQVAAPSLTGCRKAGINGAWLIWWCEVTVGKMNYTQPHWLHRDLGNDFSSWVKWSCPWGPNNSMPKGFSEWWPPTEENHQGQTSKDWTRADLQWDFCHMNWVQSCFYSILFLDLFFLWAWDELHLHVWTSHPTPTPLHLFCQYVMQLSW